MDATTMTVPRLDAEAPARKLKSTAPPGAAPALSPRENEIIRLVAAGHPNKVIADILDISPNTVATHLRRIFAKLSVASRAQMVAVATRAFES